MDLIPPLDLHTTQQDSAREQRENLCSAHEIKIFSRHERPRYARGEIRRFQQHPSKEPQCNAGLLDRLPSLVVKYGVAEQDGPSWQR